jgi:hypothetical protein
MEMIWVVKVPINESDIVDWFGINNYLDDYEQDAYVPCHYFNDSQNLEPLFWQYRARSELIKGGYRFYDSLQHAAENIQYEFKRDIDLTI